MISQSITNVLCIVSTKLSIFALKDLFHIIIGQYCIWYKERYHAI